MDRVFSAFLRNSHQEVMELTRKSDILSMTPLGAAPPSEYRIQFALPYLSWESSGAVLMPGPVNVGIGFPNHYLRSTDPDLQYKVASVLTPRFLHPNVHRGAICLGAAFAPGTSISELLWEMFGIVSYSNICLDERNALDPAACRLLRERPELLGELPRRPFLRRKRSIKLEVKSA